MHPYYFPLQLSWKRAQLKFQQPSVICATSQVLHVQIAIPKGRWFSCMVNSQAWSSDPF